MAVVMIRSSRSRLSFALTVFLCTPSALAMPITLRRPSCCNSRIMARSISSSPGCSGGIGFVPPLHVVAYHGHDFRDSTEMPVFRHEHHSVRQPAIAPDGTVSFYLTSFHSTPQVGGASQFQKSPS